MALSYHKGFRYVRWHAQSYEQHVAVCPTVAGAPQVAQAGRSANVTRARHSSQRGLTDPIRCDIESEILCGVATNLDASLSNGRHGPAGPQPSAFRWRA
jgi:hypothetical protein